MKQSPEQMEEQMPVIDQVNLGEELSMKRAELIVQKKSNFVDPIVAQAARTSTEGWLFKGNDGVLKGAF